MSESMTLKAGGATVTLAVRGALVATTKAPVVSLAFTYGVMTQSADLPVDEARRLATMLHTAATEAELQRQGVMESRGLG